MSCQLNETLIDETCYDSIKKMKSITVQIIDSKSNSRTDDCIHTCCSMDTTASFQKRYSRKLKRIIIVSLVVMLLLNVTYFNMTPGNKFDWSSTSLAIKYGQSFLTWSSHDEHTRDEIILEMNEKWIIVTSIYLPTEQIKKLSQIPEWNLVVVADKKTPKNWTFPNTTLLDIDTQLNLGYHILEFLPWNAYTRKMIGYLYAIQHGAKFIYDTDDDNAPNDPLTFEKQFVLDETTRGLIASKNQFNLTNPYAHFGQPSIWPRGYPLEYIGHAYNNTYTTCTMRTPVIQQGLVNGDPDVDAIFRLTRKTFHSPLNIAFDSSAPPVILPESMLTPFNSQNTIFHYEAFWAMLLPVSVSFRVTDIWRGYWAQPLLWIIGANLGFYPPRTTQIRNAHTYLRDFAEEDKLYKQAGALVQLLLEWQCEERDLYGCMRELSSAMVNQNMWSIDELNLLIAWISDLKSIGYKEPLILNIQNSSPCLIEKSKSFVMFSGVELQPESNEYHENYRAPLKNFCNLRFSNPNSTDNQLSTVLSEFKPIVFPFTLLVVTFNYPHYENIWLLDIIYRPHYPNILYCGHLQDSSILYNFLSTEKFVRANVKKISFVHANVTNGYFAYECAIKAIEMKYSVTGYIVLSDDVLLNFWNNDKFNTNEMWMLNNISPVSIALPINSTGWQWWGSQFGFNATSQALSKVYDSSNTNVLVQEFRTNRDRYGYNASIAMFSQSDIFYFPESKQDMLYEVASILRECEVFLELSVPFLITGLSSPQNIVHLKGIYLWGSGRNNPFIYFDISSNVIHPVKPSEVISKPELRKDFCNHYVGQVVSTGVKTR